MALSDGIQRIARLMAIMGGLVLVALIVLTCVSITGRELNEALHSDFAQSTFGGLANWLLAQGVGPVQGDFEILEAGVAFAIFAFLPLCQLNGAHATVDVFTSFLPDRINAVLKFVWEVVLTAVILLITVQLYAGTLSKMSSGETTFILQFPTWWAYAASLLASGVASLVAIYCSVTRGLEALGRPSFLPKSEGAVH